MQELLIVNPSKRRKSRKAASPAQKRARAAFARMARSRRKNPAKRRTVAKRRSNPIALSSRRRRTYRRNPISVGGMKPMNLISAALTGAVGATAVNTILAKIPLPASMMTGKTRYVTQAAAAILLGMAAQKVGPVRKYAQQMAEGSLTVTLHDLIKDVAMGAGMNLGGMGYYLPGVGVRAAPSAMAAPSPHMGGMGKYITGPGSPQGSVIPIQRMGAINKRFTF